MFRESVIVKDGEHQSLVKSIRIREILELKGFVEKRIQRFSVDFGFKLFHSFCFRHQKDLHILIKLLFRKFTYNTDISIQSLKCQIDNNTVFEGERIGRHVRGAWWSERSDWMMPLRTSSDWPRCQAGRRGWLPDGGWCLWSWGRVLATLLTVINSSPRTARTRQWTKCNRRHFHQHHQRAESNKMHLMLTI